MGIADLRNLHPGTITIVAPGPSVLNLKAEYLSVPVIAIYDAITYVEPLTQNVYALQKDGCGGKCPNCGEGPGMVRPEHATLLLHEPESGTCFPDYHKRLLFRMVEDLGFADQGNSAQAAVALARYMGATSLRLVSFDSCTAGDHGVVERGEIRHTTDYSWACTCLKNAVGDMPCEWITPRGDE